MTSTLTGQTWPIKSNITCDDANVCYSITCSHGSGACQRKPAQYVGKVGHTRPCRQRCTEHRGAVTHHWDIGVGDHFNLPGHDLAHFNFLPFEKVRSTDPFVIEARESYWIEKYRVLEEGGMNRRRWCRPSRSSRPSVSCQLLLEKNTLFGLIFKKQLWLSLLHVICLRLYKQM